MKKFILFILLGIFSLPNQYVFSDDDVNVKFDEEDNWSKWDWDFKFWDTTNSFESKLPTIELQYGLITNPFYHEQAYRGEFHNVNSFDVKIGFTDFDRVRNFDNIFSSDFKSFFISNINSDINRKSETSKVTVDAWRFGCTSSNGYGWWLGTKSNLALYHSGGISWTKLDFKNAPTESIYKPNFDVFGGVFRFSQQYESGIRVRLIDNVGINAGYERIIVFPRHLFWYWLWSEIIEGGGSGLISIFIDAIEESSPTLLPVVNFALRSALSIGFFELRKKDMNWPVATAPPLMFENIKVGITFLF